MSEEGWTVLCILVVILVICAGIYFIDRGKQKTYTIEEVDILEIIYLGGGFDTSPKTIIRCQSETYVFSGTLPLPLGRVKIEYTRVTDELYNLEKWSRLYG